MPISIHHNAPHGLYGLSNQPLSENFGAEVLNIDLTQIDEDMAEAILSAVQKHALLLFRFAVPD